MARHGLLWRSHLQKNGIHHEIATVTLFPRNDGFISTSSLRGGTTKQSQEKAAFIMRLPRSFYSFAMTCSYLVPRNDEEIN